MPPPGPVPASSSPLGGIAMALVAFALFTVMDTCVKLLGSGHSTLQVLVLTSFFAFLATTAIALRRPGGSRRVRTRRPGLHALRWAVSFGTTLAVFWVYPRVALADAYAFLFTSPLLITALSAPLLGEPVGWRRWLAVLAGFAGVLVMLRPGSGAFQLVGLVALAGAAGSAVNMLLIRRITLVDSPESVGFWGNLATVVVGGLALPMVWQTPGWADLGLSALAGTIAGSAFYLLAAAFSRAPASTLAPFQYSQMAYGLLVGWLLFGTRPDPLMLVGTAIVIASGLAVLRLEAVTRQATTAALAASADTSAAVASTVAGTDRRAGHFVVRGQVQGVGFRGHVVRAAQVLELDGWVRNRADASVEVVAAGTPAALEAFVDRLRVGPPAAKVRAVDQRPLDEVVPRGFEQRQTL